MSCSRSGCNVFCFLDKGLISVLCSTTVSHFSQAPEQMALGCSPLGYPEGLPRT